MDLHNSSDHADSIPPPGRGDPSHAPASFSHRAACEFSEDHPDYSCLTHNRNPDVCIHALEAELAAVISIACAAVQALGNPLGIEECSHKAELQKMAEAWGYEHAKLLDEKAKAEARVRELEVKLGLERVRSRP